MFAPPQKKLELASRLTARLEQSAFVNRSSALQKLAHLATRANDSPGQRKLTAHARTLDRSSSSPVQLTISVSKEQIAYQNSEAAYGGLKSSTHTTLSGKFSGDNDTLIRFFLYYFDRENEIFAKFIDLEYDILHKLENGCGGVSSRKILQGLQINPDMESLYNLMTSKQFFGTDVEEEKKGPSDAKAVFKDALRNGYRNFDTAAIYTMSNGASSLNALWEAARELGIARDQITVLHKVVHETKDHTTLDDQLRGAHATLGNLPDILMLHEITSLEQARTDLSKLTHLVRTASAKSVGVSNVAFADLEVLYRQSVEEGAPIKYVENRFNPYYNDTEVREFCNRHAIRYLGYGVIGSAQKGVCHHDGEGLPSQYLVALSDPRLQKLASGLFLPNGEPIGVGELLYVWAAHKGVSSILYSSDAGRQAKNYAAQNIRLSAEQISLIDKLVLTRRNIAEEEWGQSASAQALKRLFATVTDPTVWFLLQEICDSGSGELVNALALRILSDSSLDSEIDRKLEAFALNIVRLAADLQAKANARRKHWFADMKELFRSIALGAKTSREIFDLAYEWALKSAYVGGDAQNARQRIEQIVNGTYVPTAPVTTTGTRNAENAARERAARAASVPEVRTERAALEATIQGLGHSQVYQQFMPVDESARGGWMVALLRVTVVDGTQVVDRHDPTAKYEIHVQDRDRKLYRLNRLA